MVELSDLPTPAMIVDASRRIIEANADACALAGRDLVGLQLDDVLSAGDEEADWDGWHPSASLRSVRGIPERAAPADLSARIAGRSRALSRRPPASRSRW